MTTPITFLTGGSQLLFSAAGQLLFWTPGGLAFPHGNGVLTATAAGRWRPAPLQGRGALTGAAYPKRAVTAALHNRGVLTGPMRGKVHGRGVLSATATSTSAGFPYTLPFALS